MRPPGETLDRWVFSPGGMVLTERWALQVYGARNVTVYVFDPSAPSRSAKYFPSKLFNGLKCPPKVAPKKLEPKVPGKTSEAGPRKNKTKKEAEEPRAAKPEPKERKAEEREEREATKARLKKEADEAKRERERRAKKAESEAEKETHRRKLRELFERIEASAAQSFEAMLNTPNALAVTFRDVLHSDPLRNELLLTLAKKYMPAQCTPAALPPAPPSGVTLPPVLSNLLVRAHRAKVAAFAETDAAKRDAGLKKAGAAYTGLFYVTALWKLYVNIALVTDSADAMGVPSSITAKPEDNVLGKPFRDFENDKALLALTQAGLDADVPAMLSALPAGGKAYELHLAGLARWAASIERGAFLSKKVIQVADITMIAISIYQVWKLPAVSGGSLTPPTILGALPGGVAVGSTVSLASLARAVEAIRRLVAIGALEPIELQGVVLPDTVTSIVEFRCYDCTKIVGAEIHLTRGAFSVLFYPEDVDARPSGAIWTFVREYALAELKRLVVIRATSTTSANINGN